MVECQDSWKKYYFAFVKRYNFLVLLLIPPKAKVCNYVYSSGQFRNGPASLLAAELAHFIGTTYILKHFRELDMY